MREQGPGGALPLDQRGAHVPLECGLMFREDGSHRGQVRRHSQRLPQPYVVLGKTGTRSAADYTGLSRVRQHEQEIPINERGQRLVKAVHLVERRAADDCGAEGPCAPDEGGGVDAGSFASGLAEGGLHERKRVGATNGRESGATNGRESGATTKRPGQRQTRRPDWPPALGGQSGCNRLRAGRFRQRRGSSCPRCGGRPRSAPRRESPSPRRRGRPRSTARRGGPRSRAHARPAAPARSR